MFTVRLAENNEISTLLSKNEDHFFDIKSKRIAPADLQETFVAFANSDGGDIYIGIEDIKSKRPNRIFGFINQEEANDHLATLLEETKPSVENIDIEFIDCKQHGFILHISVPKSPKVHFTAKDKCYIRINAQTKSIKGERVLALGYAKGSYQYEKNAVDNVPLEDILESEYLCSYMDRVDTHLDPVKFLRKQRCLDLKGDAYLPNVCCVLLFDEEPQASLDTRCGIKVFRMRTSSDTYNRDQLDGMPKTVSGPIEQQIDETMTVLNEMLQNTLYNIGGEYIRLKYPTIALKEVIVNAIIHRDYSLNDDIQIIVYDNRVEIRSPGRLPGFITISNIYDERYSRNPNIVRMLHALPNPPNHDIGEGLNTVKNELKRVGLIDPVIAEEGNYVVVKIYHRRMATLEQIIIDVFRKDPRAVITNKQIRAISGEQNINIVKKALQALRKAEYIEKTDKTSVTFNYKYKLTKKGSDTWLN